MRRTLWITAGCFFFGCGGDDSTATSDDTGTSESSDEGDDPVVVDDSSSGGETTTTGIDPDTSSGAADSSSTTGAEVLCGNGEMDPGELCDDGNVEDGDACSAACAPTFELLWTVSYDGDGSFDYANDVLVGPDDSVYVLGSSRVDGNTDLWLQQVLPDGTLGWTFTWGGPDLLSDSGRAMVWTADGDLAITGYTESMATGADILVLVVDPDTQTAVWSQTFDGPGSGPGDNDDSDGGQAIAIDDDGNVVVAGEIRIGNQDWDIWLAEYSPDGMTLRWSQTHAGELGETEGAKAIVLDDAGGIELLGYQDLPTDAATVVLFYDGEGMPQPAGTVTLDTWTNDFVQAGEGRALVGNHEPANTLEDIRTWMVDATWTEIWSAGHDGAGHDVDIGDSVAVGPSGEVVAAGYEFRVNQQANAWVGAYHSDGSPWWSDSYNNEDANLGESYDAVAIDSAGDVIVVGSETVLGQQDNAFVRKYHPL